MRDFPHVQDLPAEETIQIPHGELAAFAFVYEADSREYCFDDCRYVKAIDLGWNDFQLEPLGSASLDIDDLREFLVPASFILLPLNQLHPILRILRKLDVPDVVVSDYVAQDKHLLDVSEKRAVWVR